MAFQECSISREGINKLLHCHISAKNALAELRTLGWHTDSEDGQHLLASDVAASPILLGQDVSLVFEGEEAFRSAGGGYAGVWLSQALQAG